MYEDIRPGRQVKQGGRLFTEVQSTKDKGQINKESTKQKVGGGAGLRTFSLLCPLDFVFHTSAEGAADS
jgi:hypothetical protein